MSHYGDVVNCGDQLDQWANAKSALDLLDATDIPWGVSAGNHDIKPYRGGDDAYIPVFRRTLRPNQVGRRALFLGCSPSGMSNAQIFSAGGWDFGLERDVPTRKMVWAQSVLDQHRDRVAVLTTHRYMQDEDYTAGVPVVPSAFRTFGTPSRASMLMVVIAEDIFVGWCAQLIHLHGELRAFHEEFRQTPPM